jgi:nicotinamidase-related amidase
VNAFPRFYNPERIGRLFYPDLAAIAAEADQAQLPPAAQDRVSTQLLLVDMQIDFCHAQGRLNVPGALGDLRRVVEFIYRHAAHITRIIGTLDSHLPFQIFHPAWWADADGQPPAPFTLVSAADVEAGRWRPLVEPEYSRDYVRQLEAQAKKQLVIWPYHVMLGGLGNALDPELWSAIIWHSLARKTQPAWVVKGVAPRTENYSAIQPEIAAPGLPHGGRNLALLDALAQADMVFIAGEAESHCVLETLEDLVDDRRDQPEWLRRLYVLRDCMSPVLHPQVDFHALALEQFKRFEALGVHFVDSTDQMPFAAPALAAPITASPAPIVGLDGLAPGEAVVTDGRPIEG